MFDYKFLQIKAGHDAHTIETDVVIVGSGCGGGVSARNLAEAGHKVLVVDKAYHYPPSRLPMAQDAGATHLFDNGGFFVTEDSGCTVTAGSAWGGGGTVNWSVCLKPQDFVRKEWAEEGLPLFTSTAFDECLDRVWEFQGAGTDKIRHNHRNKVLLNGSAKLGWAARPAPVNTGGREHFCGQCHLGCGLAEKRGPATSWLPDAARAGAQFMEGFEVNKVMFDSDGQTAIGVEGEWTSRDSEGGVSDSVGERIKRRVVIKAKKVILSAGSLWSPVVLKNSGITVRLLVRIKSWLLANSTRTNMWELTYTSILATLSQQCTRKKRSPGREASSPATLLSSTMSMVVDTEPSWKRRAW
jgi:choline dehydrogenase-like flavoprotein